MDDERSLRAYLLGKSSTEEQRRIEERLLGDDEYVELLLIVEAEMIDGYVKGEVPKAERREFEDYFLSTPERRRKVRMARSFRRYVNDSTSAAVAVLDRPALPWW
ncbi:MAG TPA: hypothetical protein VFV34_16990, partial [Blastocatellia bacterium]|nr:hypothetical protein [Blastocatellia bacterium]